MIVLVLLALSLGEASAGSEPDGEVMLDDLGLDLDDLADLAERAESADLGELELDERSDLDTDDLDADELSVARDRANLDGDELDRAELVVGDLASGDRASGDRASDDRAAWPATGATDARAAALASRYSLLGRFDLSLTWRRTEPIASPRRDEVWLYGTWRL